MSPSDQGFVHGMLLRYREIAMQPLGRSQRPEESRAAKILADCSPGMLDEFDQFLEGQGLGLRVLDGLADLAIPRQSGVINTFYVLTRRVGEDPPPFVDTRAFLTDFRDRRRETGEEESVEMNKALSVFWGARVWLTMNHFFYDRIDRPVGNLYSWRDALFKEAHLISQLKEDLEAMGNSGRPEGESGLLWDAYWENRAGVATFVTRFVRLMHQYGMLERTEEDDVWRQSLVAAVDMETIANRTLSYLIPSQKKGAVREAEALVTGYDLGEED